MTTMVSSRKCMIVIFGCIVGLTFLFISRSMTWLVYPNTHPQLAYGKSFIPNSPHSHGEFDEFMNNAGHMDVKHFHDSGDHSHVGEDLIAKDLYKKVRVFCWIMTNPNSHKTKALHVKATWAKRCNKYIFISSQDDPSLPTINVHVKEGRDHLWGKTKAAFAYLYQHEINNYDFFMKADDDTYVVLENLRYMLRNVDPEKPLLFGRKFKPYVKQGYMSGGAGYVISRAGLRVMMEKGFDKIPNCRRDEGGAEDVHFGQCAEAAGVVAGDSRDSSGRERFHPFPPDSHLRPIDRGNWLWSYNFYPLKTGIECCSDTSVSFHYISPEWMYILEFYVYHWQPHGVVRDIHTVRRYLGKEQRSSAAEHLSQADIQKERQLAKEEFAKAHALRSEAAQAKADAEATLQRGRKEVQKMREDAEREIKAMKKALQEEREKAAAERRKSSTTTARKRP